MTEIERRARVREISLSEPYKQQEIWDNVFPEPNSGCWIWMGHVEKSGYGAYGSRTSAHRRSYTAFKGEIPKGLHVDHLCRVRCCVNPSHLEAVTIRVNVLRGENFAAVNARKTHCPKGHEYSGDNTGYRPKRGSEDALWRKCFACHRIASRLYYDKKKASLQTLQSMVEERDEFIKAKGIWSDFVAMLPAPPTTKGERGHE